MVYERLTSSCPAISRCLDVYFTFYSAIYFTFETWPLLVSSMAFLCNIFIFIFFFAHSVPTRNSAVSLCLNGFKQPWKIGKTNSSFLADDRVTTIPMGREKYDEFRLKTLRYTSYCEFVCVCVRVLTCERKRNVMNSFCKKIFDRVEG